MLPVRSPQKIYLYQFLTLGFYFFYWCQRAGRELNQLARQQVVPSAWWFLLPGFGAYWWMWNYSEALHNLSQRRIKKSDTFLLYILVTFLYGAPFSFTDTFHSDTATSEDVKSFLILIGIVFCVVYIIELFAIGFFCSTMQKKLNATFGGPVIPTVPSTGPPTAPLPGPPLPPQPPVPPVAPNPEPPPPPLAPLA